MTTLLSDASSHVRWHQFRQDFDPAILVASGMITMLASEGPITFLHAMPTQASVRRILVLELQAIVSPGARQSLGDDGELVSLIGCQGDRPG
ncbi:hypothetical protein ACXU4B_14530 [Dyella soli]|uniref:Uncharacterized protein n=1 Tax=Dyella soli TaxID=522319 RepID=A0A4R0YVB8_9GAMM|nr:hypothetical protein [Dyella soli]TCI09136.1 hypothetical protein EZM97_23145 [Dyella soli]